MQTETPSTTLDYVPLEARNLVRWIAVITIAITVSLSITDALLQIFVSGRGDVRAAIITAVLAVSLHLRHLAYAIRGERPPAGTWTLAALAIVSAAGAYFAGDTWVREFGLLAVSIVIVVPGLWGYILAAVVIASPLFIVGTQWFVDAPFGGWYLTFAILWRTVTQIVPLRLLSALRALDSASKELEARALVQVRVRIDGDLRSGVGATLQRIIARGESALGALDADAARAATDLRQLVRESRRGLSDARRVVRHYRSSSLRAELDAATALLEASGATVRVETSDGVVLDIPDSQAHGALRGALAEALLAEPRSGYLLRVMRDDGGRVVVRSLPDDTVAEERR